MFTEILRLSNYLLVLMLWYIEGGERAGKGFKMRFKRFEG